MAQTTPPFAVPSSLVRMSPVRPSASSNAFTCASAFWPGVGVEHEQHLMRRAVERLARHALDLADLLHEVQLRRQAPGGVGDEHVDAARARGAAARRTPRRRDRPESCAITGTPLRSPQTDELLARRRAEGVARGEHHARALRLQPLRELADGGGLPRAVHARDHDDERLAPDFQLPLQRRSSSASASSARRRARAVGQPSSCVRS